MQVTRNAEGAATEIWMREPWDMHQHLRASYMLELVAPMVARRFKGAIIMPNLVPPITTLKALRRYKKEILAVTGRDFVPLMTLYLTDGLDPNIIQSEHVCGVKYYPRGLTTNSDSGVANPASLWTPGTRAHIVLKELANHGKVLLLHAADGFDRHGQELDPYEQEPYFIRETLPRIRDAHPGLKISVEHLSSITGVEYMREHGGDLLGCSLTAQHLLLDRRDQLRGGFRPHTFWWPIIQPKEHRDELRQFAGEGHLFVWLGSDSAPHPRKKKETDCCSGGVLMAHAGIELYAQAFEEMGALEQLEDFASFNGPAFYRTAFVNAVASNEEIRLVKSPWTVGPICVAGTPEDEEVIPFWLGQKVQWALA